MFSSHARICKRLAILIVMVLLCFLTLLRVSDYLYTVNSANVFWALDLSSSYPPADPNSPLVIFPPGDYRRIGKELSQYLRESETNLLFPRYIRTDLTCYEWRFNSFSYVIGVDKSNRIGSRSILGGPVHEYEFSILPTRYCWLYGGLALLLAVSVWWPVR
jgi:hypothetical protein